LNGLTLVRSLAYPRAGYRYELTQVGLGASGARPSDRRVCARWSANTPVAMMDQNRLNLTRLRGVALDVGGRDEFQLAAASSEAEPRSLLLCPNSIRIERSLHPLPVLPRAGRPLPRMGQWGTKAAWLVIRWVDKRVARRMAEQRLLGSAGHKGSANAASPARSGAVGVSSADERHQACGRVRGRQSVIVSALLRSGSVGPITIERGAAGQQQSGQRPV
jgi:hypothetical protein